MAALEFKIYMKVGGGREDLTSSNLAVNCALSMVRRTCGRFRFTHCWFRIEGYVSTGYGDGLMLEEGLFLKRAGSNASESEEG